MSKHTPNSPKPRQAAIPRQPPSTPKTLNYKAQKRPPAPSSSTPPTRIALNAVPRSRKIPLILGGLCVAGISGYCVLLWQGAKRDAAAARSKDIPEDVSDRYKHNAETYDSQADFMEWMMGINSRRKQLASRITGPHILETSVGTGRNGAFYPLATSNIKTITMVDKNAQMLDVARLKWANENGWFINAIFWLQDAATPVPCPSDEGFDTIIQTMGLCSTVNPVEELQNLGRMAKPDTGKILLLEHGRSYYEWLNRYLDEMAPAHADRHGCWFNKDIGKIIEESGLEIVECKRFHLGTTWWYELKPPRRITLGEKILQSEPLQSTSTKPWWAIRWK